MDYSRRMAKLANEDDLIPGLGLPSIHNGPWDVEIKRRDIRDVYKVYTEEVVSRNGQFTPQIEADLKVKVLCQYSTCCSSTGEVGTVSCLGAAAPQ